MRIERQNLRGTIPKTAQGDPVVYFHLKARSRCTWLPVHNCRAMLTKVERLDPATGSFKDVGLCIPLQFMWSPGPRRSELRTTVGDVKIEKLSPASGCSNDIRLHVPLKIVWSPEKDNVKFRTLIQEEVFDFLAINRPTGAAPTNVWPVLYESLSEFDLDVHANETLRYHISVIGNEFASARPQIWEVFSDGTWTEKVAELSQHVTIREVPNA